MLQPKKAKYRKWHRKRGDEGGVATTNTRLAFAPFGLKAITSAEVTSRQIEAARRVITHACKRGGKLWIRVFPHKPITRKGAEVPMGSGKGAPEFHVTEVYAGTILFELDGLAPDLARQALKLAGAKLPVKVRVVTNQD